MQHEEGLALLSCHESATIGNSSYVTFSYFTIGFSIVLNHVIDEALITFCFCGLDCLSQGTSITRSIAI